MNFNAHIGIHSIYRTYDSFIETTMTGWSGQGLLDIVCGPWTVI